MENTSFADREVSLPKLTSYRPNVRYCHMIYNMYGYHYRISNHSSDHIHRYYPIPCELAAEGKEKMAAEKRNKSPRLVGISGSAGLRNLYKGIKGKFAMEEI
jgi:hypothetical protein